jgi:Regulator of G protein signaling domain/Domain of unknown function (DUF4157)
MRHQQIGQTKKAIAASNREITEGIARYSPHPIEELQSAIGNQAVNRLLANQPVVQAKPMFRGLSGELRSPTPLQAQLAKEADSASLSEVQPENKTGLPDNLKAGIENLSGIAMDDVRVHKNSSKPSDLQALAYTQGIDIHLAPGQQQHLPHEAWHVVQQKQGRVKPTIQTKGVEINDDRGLEKEADVMGSKALQMKSDESTFEVLDNSPEAVAQTKIPDIQDRQVDVLGTKVVGNFTGVKGTLQCARNKKPPKYTFSNSEDTEENKGELDDTIKPFAQEKDSTQSQEKPSKKPNFIKRLLNRRFNRGNRNRVDIIDPNDRTESQPIPEHPSIVIPERLYDKGEQLQNSQMFNLFLEFCTHQERNSENPLFWKDVTEFENNPNLDKAQQIFETYIKENAFHLVTIDNVEIVRKIAADINSKNIQNDTFEKAKTEVIGMMQGTWQKFYKFHQKG